MRVDRPARAMPDNDRSTQQGHDVGLDFVRFCYRRRRVAWPELYDEMCAVAARGAFRGLGYAELGEHGISFCLTDLPRLAGLSQRVALEDLATSEPARSEPSRPEMNAVRLAAAQAVG